MLHCTECAVSCRCEYTQHCFSCCLSVCEQGEATITMGGQSRLLWRLFCNAASRRERITKWAPFPLVEHCKSQSWLVRCVWQASFFPLCQLLLERSRNCQETGALGTFWFMLLSEFWSVATTQDGLLFTWANCQQLVCDSLRIMRIKLILGVGTDCVCIWQPTFRCSWDCLRHSVEVRGRIGRENVHFVWGVAEFCQHLLAVTLSLAWFHSPNHWTWHE